VEGRYTHGIRGTDRLGGPGKKSETHASQQKDLSPGRRVIPVRRSRIRAFKGITSFAKSREAENAHVGEGRGKKGVFL